LYVDHLPALLYLAPNLWDGSRQRAQHLASGLARTRPVVFVEPTAYSFNGTLRRRLTGRRTVPLRGRATRFGERLLVFGPVPSLPFSLHLRGLNRLAHHLSWLQLRRLLRPLGGRELDVVVGWPPALELARQLRPRRLVYDCMDLFPAFPQPGPARATMAALEAELVDAAWAVVVPSRALERRWADRHSRVVRIPNGVELDRFLTGEIRPEPADMAGLPRPRLGYIGTIGRWIDLELLDHLARSRPDWSVVLIGPSDQVHPPPHRPPNLHLLGERAYPEIPAYLAALDALLIPFRLSDLTQAVNPIKLYEYCASGKPIAATPIEEVAVTGDLCHLGQGPDGFMAAAEAALAEAAQPDPVRVAARQALARASAWDRRVAAFSALLDA
jgi:hypothetical protein